MGRASSQRRAKGLVLGRQPARTKQAFEALEGELDVPAKTVRLQRIARGHLGGQRGGQHQVARGPHRQRLQGAVRAAPVLPAVLRLRGPSRCRRREARHDPARRDYGLATGLAALGGVADRDRPLGDLAGRQVTEDPRLRHQHPVRVEQAEPGQPVRTMKSAPPARICRSAGVRAQPRSPGATSPACQGVRPKLSAPRPSVNPKLAKRPAAGCTADGLARPAVPRASAWHRSPPAKAGATAKVPVASIAEGTEWRPRYRLPADGPSAKP